MTLQEIVSKLDRKEQFAFSRWGDGEFAALFGDEGQNCDGVRYESDMVSELKKILSEADYYLGKQPYYPNLYTQSRIRQIEALSNDWIDADVFHTASKKGELRPFLKALGNRDVILVGNGRLKNLDTFFEFEFIQTPSTDTWSKKEGILPTIKVKKDTVVLFACGISANWFVHQLSGKCTAIDVGSLFDPFVGSKTRQYHGAVSLRQATPINVTMATVPKREKYAVKAVKSILNCNVKPDSFHLELNGFSKVPKWVNELPITYTLRKENIGAKAKFARLNQTKGYYLTVDDDIEYPSSYIGHMTHMIDFYNREALVGIHGSTHRNPRIRSYWNDVARKFHFQSEVKQNTICSMLGTGTLGFHTSIGLSFEVFEKGNQTDPYLSKWAIENGVKQIVLARKANYVKQINGSQDTGGEIWKSAMEKDTEQTAVINSINSIKFARYLRQRI